MTLFRFIMMFIIVAPGLSACSSDATRPVLLTQKIVSSSHTLSGTPSTVTSGSNVSVDWTAPADHSTTDWIGLYQVGAPDSDVAAFTYVSAGSSGTVRLTLPTDASGNWEFRYFANATYESQATSAAISVQLLAAGYALTGSPAKASMGSSVRINWTAPANHPATDWIGLYQVGASDRAYAAWAYVAAGTSGATSLTLPVSATGNWEFRYYASNFTLRAKSNSFSVQQNNQTYALVGAPISSIASSTVTVTWAAPVDHADTDWIGLFQVGADGSEFKAYAYVPSGTSGTLSMTLPETASGNWEFRYYASGSYTLKATSATISLPQSTNNYGLSGTPSTATPGTAVSVNWSAPAGHATSDWVGLYQVGAADRAYKGFAYVASATSGTLSLTLPSTASGSWEFRYYSNNYALRATSASFSVPLATSAYTFSNVPTSATAGNAMTVGWTAPAGHAANDWIGLYQLGAADSAFKAFAYVPAGTSGTVALILPAFSYGNWELRYHAAGRFDQKAKSVSISAQPASTDYVLTSAPSSASAGQAVSVEWNAIATHSPYDWIGLFQTSATDTSYVGYAYVTTDTSGVVTLTLPANATGDWEFRYFTHNSFNIQAKSTIFVIP